MGVQFKLGSENNMRAAGLVLLVVCAAAHAQQSYDGKDGPYIFGKPGHQTYIRGQKEGVYQVDGVQGTFEHSPSNGEHVYTDAQGNTYVHRKNPGGPSSHTVSGPSFTAFSGPVGPVGQALNSHPDRTVFLDNGGVSVSRQSRDITASRPDRTVNLGKDGISVSRQSRDITASRPDRTVNLGKDGISVSRQSRDITASRPDRTVHLGKDGISVSRQSRDITASRPDRTVSLGKGGISVSRQSRDITASRPDRTVSFGKDGISVSRQSRDTVHVSRPDRYEVQHGPGYKKQRSRRSPEMVVGPDGRYVSDEGNTRVFSRPDGRTVVLEGDSFTATRQRRSMPDSRVQGPGFVARDNQACVWNKEIYVCRRPDGRTVTTFKDGSYDVAAPGRETQHYKG